MFSIFPLVYSSFRLLFHGYWLDIFCFSCESTVLRPAISTQYFDAFVFPPIVSCSEVISHQARCVFLLSVVCNKLLCLLCYHIIYISREFTEVQIPLILHELRSNAFLVGFIHVGTLLFSPHFIFSQLSLLCKHLRPRVSGRSQWIIKKLHVSEPISSVQTSCAILSLILNSLICPVSSHHYALNVIYSVIKRKKKYMHIDSSLFLFIGYFLEFFRPDLNLGSKLMKIVLLRTECCFRVTEVHKLVEVV